MDSSSCGSPCLARGQESWRPEKSSSPNWNPERSRTNWTLPDCGSLANFGNWAIRRGFPARPGRRIAHGGVAEMAMKGGFKLYGQSREWCGSGICKYRSRNCR